jgi:hypothetical protein
MLLDDFTSHWRRHKVTDQSMDESARQVGSLSELVHCSRLDLVEEKDGHPVMSLL